MTVINVDCLLGMAALLGDSEVDAIMCDPPYGIRFMGMPWDDHDIEKRTAARRNAPSKYEAVGSNGAGRSAAAEAGKYDLSPAAMLAFQRFSAEWAREAFRVLKPGAYLLSFASTRTYHRMACGVEEAGFEIRDQIGWLFGSGFPKSHNGPWGGTALKPAWEPIVVARKPLIGTVRENWAAHCTGALNIDGCRVDGPGGVKRVTPRGGIWKTDVDADADLVQNDLGRWPANLMHDGSGEVLAAFPSDEQRFFYCAKASRKDRNEGCDALPMKAADQAHKRTRDDLDDPRRSGTDPQRNHHPTVKPTELMRYLCRLVTPPGGLILDPFAGSGSTGKAAALEGFRFIGFELSGKYTEIANARIACALAA